MSAHASLYCCEYSLHYKFMASSTPHFSVRGFSAACPLGKRCKRQSVGGITCSQAAGSSGSIRLEDFVIPRTEKVSQFQVRDGKFLEDNATRVAQSAEERTVSSLSHLHAPWMYQDIKCLLSRGHCNIAFHLRSSPPSH
jgi:hypothetical protein